MIRIDEIYHNTIWSYVHKNIPSTRLFFCDPPGSSQPENLFNFGKDNVKEVNYIFLHDQEPIHLDIHHSLFNDVVRRNTDMCYPDIPLHQAIITSEWDSEFVDEVCSRYIWRHYYYFYHGWASIDWYRGYDRTWLMPAPEDRKINKSFIAPNRIIGGRREHRVILLYHFFKNNINNAWISAPRTCPYEDITIEQIALKFQDHYPDIISILESAPLPLHFPGETDHPMHSCWLSLFDECAETLTYLVTETVFFGRRNHLTEKTFKPICQQMPFVLASTAGSLEYLRRYGFRTFGNIWDESYDEEIDDFARLGKISKLLKDLDSMSTRELNDLYHATLPAVKHNYEHFYKGGFEQILWAELTKMLDTMRRDFND